MEFAPHDVMRLIIGGSAFVLVLSMWVAVLVIWSMRRSGRRQMIEQRLQLGEHDPTNPRVLRLWRAGREGTVARPKRVRVPLVRRLERLLRDAEWTIPVPTFAALTVLGSGMIFLAVYAVTGTMLPAGGAVALVIIVLWTLLQRRVTRRAALFESQLVDALEVAARSLRAGHPLVGAFKLIASEIPPPVGRAFAEICQSQELGVSLENAIRSVAGQTSSSDLKLFGTSIAIQLRSGGNLADMVDRLAYVIRDRMRLSRRIRVITAQTQFSKWILVALPFLTFVVLNILNPEYMRPLYTTETGRMLMGIGIASLTLGIWIMNRLTVLRY